MGPSLVWNQPEVSLLVSGMHTREQVEENVRLASLPDTSLSVDDFLVLDRALAALHEKDIIPCTQCGFMCPQGIDIPNWLHMVARYFDEHHITDGWH